MDIFAVTTQPFADQNFGTSGLRKKTSVFRQEHYLENIVQSIFDSLVDFEGQTLVIGGDGRYGNDEAIQTIIKMAIANQFGHIIVGQNGLLSTPATSHIIVKYHAFGGIILTASHNPGGKEGDFGIKYNIATGGPAPETLTQVFAEKLKSINHYWMSQMNDIDLSKIGEQTVGSTLIEVIDSVADYADYMAQIFDFKALKKLFLSGFRFTFDAMNAVTGPYAQYIFEQCLSAPKGSVINAKPLKDFGGLHPEPNLTYAKELVDRAYGADAPDLCAASDGDGDRYMILGQKFFVNPADSLAILATYLEKIPFYKGRFYGLARSMPTGAAVDFVCAEQNKNCYQTPTGWKFFGNLLEHQYISLCGEESFGAGSFHVMEKDGLWAILCWLSIIAITGKTPEQLVRQMWQKYGRIYNQSINYTVTESEKARHLMDELGQKLPSLVGKKYEAGPLSKAYHFDYTDPITQVQTIHQGIILEFGPHDTVMLRLSGTVSTGATLKVYLHHWDKQTDLELDSTLLPIRQTIESILDLSRHFANDIQITTT